MNGNKNEIIKYLLEQEDDKYFNLKEVKENKTDKQRRYCWALINEIANVVNKSKEKVYIDYLEHYSQSDYISIKEDVPIENYFDYYKKVGSAELQGKTFNHYLVFVGMSKMNKKEMMIFIQGISNEAEQLGIDTLESKELRKMVEKYEKRI